MSDVNTSFEAHHIPKTPAANFDAEILPNFQQGGKGAQADAKDSVQSAAKDGAAGAQASDQKSVDFSEIKTAGWPDAGQGNRPELHPQRQEMVNAAEAAVGTQPWKSHERADITQGGSVAGGINLSAIVRAAGYPNVDASYIRGTNGVEDQLMKNHGWVKNEVSAAKPGDIYIVPAPTGGSASTVGIVGKDGSLYSHSKDGTVTRYNNRPLRSNGYVLSPPEKN